MKPSRLGSLEGPLLDSKLSENSVYMGLKKGFILSEVRQTFPDNVAER